MIKKERSFNLVDLSFLFYVRFWGRNDFFLRFLKKAEPKTFWFCVVSCATENKGF